MSATLTIRIPEKLRDRLEIVSQNEDKAMSDIVRDSLKSYLFFHEFRSLRNRIIPFAEKQGFFTDDDIFEKIP